jgi:hypothetical protein
MAPDKDDKYQIEAGSRIKAPAEFSSNAEFRPQVSRLSGKWVDDRGRKWGLAERCCRKKARLRIDSPRSPVTHRAPWVVRGNCQRGSGWPFCSNQTPYPGKLPRSPGARRGLHGGCLPPLHEWRGDRAGKKSNAWSTQPPIGSGKPRAAEPTTPVSNRTVPSIVQCSKGSAIRETFGSIVHHPGACRDAARDSGLRCFRTLPLSRHSTALFRAGVTRLRAFLAMICVVLHALVTARLADIGAQRTNVRRKIAAACHGCGGQSTDRRAVDIGANASGHHGRIGFCQTCRRTMITDFGATVTRCNAAGILLMSHSSFLD